MKNKLIPTQLTEDEWIIICPPIFDAGGYEEFSNMTYPSREACQKAIDNLYAALPHLLVDARNIIARWQSGDLAGAVRELDQALKMAWR